MTSLESAAAAFVEDVKKLGREYAQDAAEVCAPYEAVKAECDARLEEARRAQWEAARELNANYSERVGNAARIRAQQAQDAEEHAEDIRDAAASVVAILGGACRDEFYFNDDVARARVEAAAKRREDAEAYDMATRGGGIVFL